MWEFIVNLFTNVLLLFLQFLGNNFFLALAVFTVLTRLAMLPLNLRQQRSMMKQQEMQPQIQAIQKKYKDDQQKMMEEFQKIGYNPAESLTGCLPLLATMPILFGLFQVLRLVLSTTPQSLFELTQRSYSWINLTELLPINSSFLWLNLGQPDQFYLLPLLVFVTMFFQTRFTTPSANKKDKDKDKKGKKEESDPTQAMTQSMQYTMPIMFGFFSLSFPSGLSVYFVLSNLISMAQGLYTKNIIEKEKALKAEQKVKTEMGMGDVMPQAQQIVEEKPEPEPAPNKETSAKKKSQNKTSKRKRRSAKR